MLWTKKNQGKSFHIYRGELLNVPEYYDDEAECSINHLGLLTEYYKVTSSSEVLRKIIYNMINEKDKPHICHRNVLEKSKFSNTGKLNQTETQREKINNHGHT